MADVEAGLIDVIVVYKIDRLSRSLMDFAKLVEIFERNNVTFVSVTQSFNTTTSMGRLTLNRRLAEIGQILAAALIRKPALRDGNDECGSAAHCWPLRPSRSPKNR